MRPEIKPGNRNAGEKNSANEVKKIKLRNAETVRGERLIPNNGIQICADRFCMAKISG